MLQHCIGPSDVRLLCYYTSDCRASKLSESAAAWFTVHYMMRIRIYLGCIVACAPFTISAQNPPSAPPPVVVPMQSTAAQLEAAKTGTGVSNAQIADAIRNSGLTEAQVRARLQAAGFDPRLADPYFQGGIPGSLAPAANPSAVVDVGFADALKALGIVDTVANEGTGTRRSETDATHARTNESLSVLNPLELRLFGKALFTGETTAFDAVSAGPVDASYRLGIGDQLQLIITGDMESATSVEVRRDGTIFVPQIGQIPVAGLTLEAARTSVKQRAARVFSVISEGAARVDLTVSRVRTNQVFVVGEVERPGSYQVNALATVFRALNSAGGPTLRGTFRNVEVRRAGTVVARVDIYDYLLRGDASNDVRTEQGDIIFVGLSNRLVALRGAVRRPGVYELREGESLSRLIEFGGGLLPTAATDRVQIDRVLPPAERAPGKERALIDIPFHGGPGSLDTLRLYDSDVVSVFTVGDIRRNRVVLEGEVFEPGMYEWTPGLTLGSLISKAKGFLPWALADRIKIERQIPHTGRSELFSISASDSSLDKVALAEYDNITVLDARRAFPVGTISIAGAVVTPGDRQYVEKMTLKDFVDLSGGFKPEAAVVELARRKLGSRYSDTAAVVHTFQVLPGGRLDTEAASVVLEPDDRVNVRDFPGFRISPRRVTLIGLFTYPGSYVLRSDAEKVSDVVRRAGGLLPSAYTAGARLIRDGRPVAIDLGKALKRDRAHDIHLSQGDRLEVGADPSVVYVAGAVERQVIVPFHRGWKVGDYISAAGGFSADAEKGNIVIEYPSGEILSRRKYFLRPTGDPPIISGSTITVGQKTEGKGLSTGDVLTRTVQVVTTLVSLVIGYMAVRR